MNKLSKHIKIFKIYSIIACVIIIALFSFDFILSFTLEEGELKPYFNIHFLTPICLALMGSVAYLLPRINQTASGDARGENAMKIAGLLFILIALVTLIFSFF